MTWMITATGREYHYSGAMAHTDVGRPVHIDDIAHQLALINRFHGATSRPYSVAEHSLLVADIARREGATPIAQLAALMHDAHEAYTQDLASPAKAAVNLGGMGHTAPWAAFEHEHAGEVMCAFGLLTAAQAHRHDIRRWDLIALATERRDLTAWDPARHQPWAVLGDGTPQAVQPLADVDLINRDRCSNAWFDWSTLFANTYHAMRREALGAAA